MAVKCGTANAKRTKNVLTAVTQKNAPIMKKRRMTMADMYYIELEAMNETREVCCDGEKCNKRYWEACNGIKKHFGYVEGCAVAVSKYYEILGKLKKERVDNDKS